MWTLVLRIFFFVYQVGGKIHTRQCIHDKKGLCSKILISPVKHFVQLYYNRYFAFCADSSLRLLRTGAKPAYAVRVYSVCSAFSFNVWLRHDISDGNGIFPRYGIPLGCCSDGCHVYERNYVYARKNYGERICLDLKI